MAAIHALFRYAALRCPEHAELIARVLAIPSKRCEKRLLTFLTRAEAEALISAPNPRTPLGRRDQLLLTVATHTGLRVSDLTGLTCGDVAFGAGAHVRCTGKGRKERCTPLTSTLARQLRTWLTDRQATPADPLFPTVNGRRMSTDAVERALAKNVAVASRCCPSLTTKKVTPHTLRHTCAMNLLRVGLDTSSIALWLGHANTQPTQAYLHADLAIKEQTLALAAPPEITGHRRYRPPDRLLSFLEGL
jgi:integrase/recombinase XerD